MCDLEALGLRVATRSLTMLQLEASTLQRRQHRSDCDDRGGDAAAAATRVTGHAVVGTRATTRRLMSATRKDAGTRTRGRRGHRAREGLCGGGAQADCHARG